VRAESLSWLLSDRGLGESLHCVEGKSTLSMELNDFLSKSGEIFMRGNPVRSLLSPCTFE
jgi:ABC-type cobalamin transport system ATPase subunit